MKKAIVALYVLGGVQSAMLTYFNDVRSCRQPNPVTYIISSSAWPLLTLMVVGMKVAGDQTRYEETLCGLGIGQ